MPRLGRFAPVHLRMLQVSRRVVVMRRGRLVADKAIALSSPEEVTGLITGARAAA